MYKGWTDSDYYESRDAIHWEKKAALKLGEGTSDGFYQVFIDPSSPPEERFKATWVGLINRARFEAFRAKRPDGWEPRAVFLLGEKDEVTCLRGGVSPDGIRWKTLADPLVVEYCDTWNTAYFDPALREYVIYTRALVHRPSIGSAPAGHPGQLDRVRPPGHRADRVSRFPEASRPRR